MAYINDSVLNCLKKQLCELECNPDKFSKVKARFLKNNVIPTIEGYKSVDVVEVVRCKDCKHWNCVSRVTEHMGCNIFYGAYGREYPTNPDDFCSYGEKEK